MTDISKLWCWDAEPVDTNGRPYRLTLGHGQRAGFYFDGVPQPRVAVDRLRWNRDAMPARGGR